MFTGLITDIGQIDRMRRRGNGGAELTVRIRNWQEPPRIGESIAVQGICLTVSAAHHDRFCCDVLRETLTHTNLGRLRPGSEVNLERALQAGDRLGGHLVSGHIDGAGLCVAIGQAGPDIALSVRARRELISGIVPKGSIACDGVSLTVVKREPDRFTVHVIPHTWQATTLRRLKPGDIINLETDMIGKYAAQRLTSDSVEPSGITLEKLYRSGFTS